MEPSQSHYIEGKKKKYGDLIVAVGKQDTLTTVAEKGQVFDAFYEDSTLEKRLQEIQENSKADMAELELEIAKLNESVGVLSEPYLVTVGAEILLYAIGQQPRGVTKSKRVSRSLNSDLDGKIEAFCSMADPKIGVKTFVQISDQLIDRTNNYDAHFNSLKVLNDKVASAKTLFENQPYLKEKHEWEWFMIRNYNLLKKVFNLD